MPVQDRGPHRTKFCLPDFPKTGFARAGASFAPAVPAHAHTQRAEAIPCSFGFGRPRRLIYPFCRFSFRRKTLRPRLRSTLVSGFWGWGGSSSPRLATLGQFSGQPIVHCVVRFAAEADQVPRLPGVLRKILSRPDVVNGCGLNRHAVSGCLPASPSVSPQDTLPEPSPPPGRIAVPHTASPPGKTKSRLLRSFAGSRQPATRALAKTLCAVGAFRPGYHLRKTKTPAPPILPRENQRYRLTTEH